MKPSLRQHTSSYILSQKIMCVDGNLTINATIKLTYNDRAANRYAINGSGFLTCIDASRPNDVRTTC